MKEFKTDEICPDWTTGQQKTGAEEASKTKLGGGDGTGQDLTLHKGLLFISVYMKKERSL